MTPDSELLRQFAKTNSEDAFAELVKRHVSLVYSAALRQVAGDAHLAQDVAQTVFADLARKAGPLARRESLTGWLYTSAYFAAAKMIRGENRRRSREEMFMREPMPETSPEADWEKIRSQLDDAMRKLAAADREAVLLRYFENRPFAEVGAKLGLKENAARMRVERALDKLRAVFARRGVTTAGALASVISANAVQTAPVGLAASVVSGSLAVADAGASFTLMKFLTTTKLKLVLSALVVAGAATGFMLQRQAQAKLRGENESLQRQVAKLRIENERLSNRLSTARDSQSLTEAQLDELLRLRGEVTRLRQQQPLSPIVAPVPTNNPDSVAIEIHTKARFISIPAGDLQLLGIQWMPDAQVSQMGVLTGPQFEALRAAFRGASDVETIAEPEVITSNGREADMCAAQAAPVHGTNANIGIDLDLIPYFSTNSSKFNLNLVAELNQLTGDPAEPELQTIQVTNRVTLSPGQTVVLAKKIPEGGWLPEATNIPAGPRSLLVFVTPQVVDPRGKPMGFPRSSQ